MMRDKREGFKGFGPRPRIENFAEACGSNQVKACTNIMRRTSTCVVASQVPIPTGRFGSCPAWTNN